MTRDIREGMTVLSADGEKLGKVIRCDPDAFIIEKGFFFPKDYVVRYEDARASGDEVVVSFAASGLREVGERPEGTREEDVRETRLGHGVSEEVRVPVAEEELVAEKREREAGEVRIHKDVVTEHRQVDVPVTREEVHVERSPVQGGEARAADARLEKDEIRVPVREEEVEIRKRPVVKEEVRVSRSARREERRAEADVRREEVDVEKEGDVDQRGERTYREPEE